MLADAKSLLPEIKFNRRHFLMTSLATGFAAATHPVIAQTTITTPSTGLIAGEVKVKTADGEMPAYRAMPETGTNFPVILVVQEIFGVHEHIRDVCRRLAKSGYMAIAPELYARQGDASKVAEIPTLLREIVSKVPDAQVMSDLDATVEYAKKSGKANASKLGITGFCWGGRITWLYAAHNPHVKAGVAWYGRLVGEPTANSPTNPIDLVGKLHAPVLGLYGGADQGIPVASIAKMQEALKGAKKKAEFVVYPDTGHAFHADYRPSYRKDPAEDGWKRMLAWFKENGVG